MLFSFAFSAIPHKLPCLVATLLFFIFQVKNFVTGAVSTIETHAGELIVSDFTRDGHVTEAEARAKKYVQIEVLALSSLCF